MASGPTTSDRASDEKRDLAVHQGDEHGGPTLITEKEQTARFADEAEYKAVLNRVFWRIVPYFSLLYLLSFLDRVNIGQARLAGLERDLGMNPNGTDYQTALAVFFASYVFFEVPAALLLKRMKPHIFVFVTMILWSICSTLMALSRNAGQLIAIRFLLGIFEAGLFPGLNFVLSLWLPASALGIAVSVFFAGATLSGALGGLLALGIRQMAGIANLGGWAWIFIIEGLITFVCALPSWWLVPDFVTDPAPRVFKTELDRMKWLDRLSRTQGINVAHVPFTTSQVTRAIKDWKVWVFAVMYLSIAQPFYSLSLFTPTIIAGLGFTNAAANGLSAAPYVLGFISTLLTGVYSDRIRRRGIFIIGWMSIVILGYIILLCPVSNGAKYFAIFLTVMGVSPCIAMSITWVGQQYGPVYKRATGMGLHFTFGNSAGIISSFVYPAAEGPRFYKGHGIALAFSALAIVCAIILWIGNAKENARRNAKYGTPAADGSETTLERLLDPEELHKWHLEGKSREEILDLGDRHPAYRYLC